MKYKLEDIDKKQAFKVPDGYFENLPLQIQTKIQKENKPKSVVMPSWKFALAASVLVFVITFVLSDITFKDSAESMLAEIPQNELIAYMDNMDLDIEELTSTFENTTEELEFENLDGMEKVNIDEEDLDDILLEFDITEDYL